MNIAIAGTGYVGLANAVLLAQHHHVTAVDLVAEKVDKINRRISPLADLEITVVGGNQLTVKGERRPLTPEKGVWHRQERAFGPFSRTLALPFHVDPERVEARLENGVLTVKLAKHESARPRKIVVKAE